MSSFFNLGHRVKNCLHSLLGEVLSNDDAHPLIVIRAVFLGFLNHLPDMLVSKNAGYDLSGSVFGWFFSGSYSVRPLELQRSREL